MAIYVQPSAEMSNASLATNELYPSVRVRVRGGDGADVHLPLQEHCYRGAGATPTPTTFFYVLPKLAGAEVVLSVRNLGARKLWLVQRNLSLPGEDECCECAAWGEVELPLRLRVREGQGYGDGVDVRDARTEEVLLRLRFDGRPLPPGFVALQGLLLELDGRSGVRRAPKSILLHAPRHKC